MLAAYSGGTAGEVHPLRVAAGVGVRLAGVRPSDGQPGYSRRATERLFCVTLVGSCAGPAVQVRTHLTHTRGNRMSKSSTVTVRERPVEEVASAKIGGVTIHGETIVIQTDQRIELVDLTVRVME